LFPGEPATRPWFADEETRVFTTWNSKNLLVSA
jgi:hypothetical protein